MNFKKHYELIDQHAFLSPSKHHWIHYDVEKMSKTYIKHLGVQMGTRLHKLASELIDLRITLQHNGGTFGNYINDCIKDNMIPEQPLYYSDNCFGTADAISFENNYLRIYDLKTGLSPVSMDQLKIYAALFCLEYSYDPKNIIIELRIYQRKKPTKMEIASPDEIASIMDQIILCDDIIENIKESREIYYE